MCREWEAYRSASTDEAGAQDSRTLIADQYIVVFQDYKGLEEGQEMLRSTMTADQSSDKPTAVMQQLDAVFHALVVRCDGRVLERLAEQSGVLAIVQDEIVRLDEVQEVGEVCGLGACTRVLVCWRIGVVYYCCRDSRGVLVYP